MSCFKQSECEGLTDSQTQLVASGTYRVSGRCMFYSPPLMNAIGAVLVGEMHSRRIIREEKRGLMGP